MSDGSDTLPKSITLVNNLILSKLERKVIDSHICDFTDETAVPFLLKTNDFLLSRSSKIWLIRVKKTEKRRGYNTHQGLRGRLLN